MTSFDEIPRVYIAGPMTGHEHFNYPAFYDAYDRLYREGFRVASPAHDAYGKRMNPPVPGYEDDYRVYLRYGIEKLLGCDLIFLLPGWETSRGARLEKQIADAMGIREVTTKLTGPAPTTTTNRATTTPAKKPRIVRRYVTDEEAAE